MSTLDTKLTSLAGQIEELVDLIVKFKTASKSLDGSAKELVSTIQFKFQTTEAEFGYLKYEIDDVLQPEEKQYYQNKYAGLQEEFRTARFSFRKSQVEGQKSTTEMRRELLGNINDQINKKNKTNPQKSQLVSKAEDVTAVMRQLHKMAQTEAIVSSINLEELEQSTISLQQLQMRYSGFNLLLTGSRQLIRHLEQADRWDRIYMLASLGFLFLVLAWIIWRRILKAPVYLLFSTAKFVVRVGGKAGGVVAGKKSVSVVSPLASTQTSVLVASATESVVSVVESVVSSIVASSSSVVESVIPVLESASSSIEPVTPRSVSAASVVESVVSSIAVSSSSSVEPITRETESVGSVVDPLKSSETVSLSSKVAPVIPAVAVESVSSFVESVSSSIKSVIPATESVSSLIESVIPATESVSSLSEPIKDVREEPSSSSSESLSVAVNSASPIVESASSESDTSLSKESPLSTLQKPTTKIALPKEDL